MSTLLIEPLGGLAGDMLLAALLDLGQERFALADLRRLAQELVPGEAELSFSHVSRGGVQAGHLAVHTPESQHAPHRHYSDLEKLVGRAACLSDGARKRSLDALWRLAEAEGRVHGCAPEAVHFHEVGAVDTLIDVCGAAMALDLLGVTRVVASAPLLGSGTVRCAHGVMPVPAPATEQLMRGLPAREGGAGERLTPTGATILASWVDEFEPMGAFRTLATGYGAGTRDPKQGPPNFARVRLGEGLAGSAQQAAGGVWRLDVNLDDMTAEEIGHAVQQLRAAGALEVWSSPLLMKKDRPGTLVSLLARGAQRDSMERLLFEWTTTLGVRWSQVERTECGRRELRLELDGLLVRVKLRERPDYAERSPFGARDVAPEHDDLVRLAEARGASLRETREACVRAALAELSAQAQR